MRLLKKDIVVNAISFYFARMFYPHRKIFTIPLTLKKKWRKNQTIFLKIPQATIRERSELSMIKDDEKIKFFIKKLSDWGA